MCQHWQPQGRGVFYMRWNRMGILLLGMVMAFSWAGNLYAAGCSDSVMLTEEANFSNDASVLPEAVKAALLDEVLYMQSAKLTHHDNKAYVILSLGLCRSTGYNLTVTNARLKDGQLVVWVQTERPSSEDFIGWIITQPMKIFSMPDEDQKVKNLTVIYN